MSSYGGSSDRSDSISRNDGRSVAVNSCGDSDRLGLTEIEGEKIAPDGRKIIYHLQRRLVFHRRAQLVRRTQSLMRSIKG
jgi:hypothetical protein